MNDKKNIFDVNPSDQHVARVEKSVENLLAENRKKERRKFFTWILAPTFASVMGFLFWRNKSVENFNPEQALLLQLEEAEDLEIIVNIEMLEDLEFLEEWDESTET